MKVVCGDWNSLDLAFTMTPPPPCNIVGKFVPEQTFSADGVTTTDIFDGTSDQCPLPACQLLQVKEQIGNNYENYPFPQSG